VSDGGTARSWGMKAKPLVPMLAALLFVEPRALRSSGIDAAFLLTAGDSRQKER
jgi:hypothetical protein